MNPREARGRAFRISAHPWAGLLVDMTLTARDQAGRRGLSKPVRFQLAGAPVQQAACQCPGGAAQGADRAPAEKTRTGGADAGGAAGVAERVVRYQRRLHGRSDGGEPALCRRQPGGLRQIVDLLWEIAISVEDGRSTMR